MRGFSGASEPVSDLFIVYTDNYFYSFDSNQLQDNFQPKNRAIVIKFTYWINI